MMMGMMKQFQENMMKNMEEDSRRLRRDMEEQVDRRGWERGWGWQDEEEGKGVRERGKEKRNMWCR